MTGKPYEDDYTKIEYSNVTINLQDYLVAVQEFWRNESSGRFNSPILEQKESFSGLLNGRLAKCFMLNGAMENNRHIKKIYFYYNLPKLFAHLEEDFYKHDLNAKRSISIILQYKIHYPGKFLDGRYFAAFKLREESIATQLYINELELINSRNSKHRICSENVDSYDNMVIKNWLSRGNCRVPYLKASNDFPFCNSSQMIKRSQFHYDTPRTLNIPSSCRRISKLQFEPETIYNPNDKVWEPMSLWWFSIVYPDEFRIITQSKEVDIHALIGNIGGYLGLFLGMSSIFKCQPYFTFNYEKLILIGNCSFVILIGYSLIQIPDILCNIIENVRKHLSKNKQIKRNKVQLMSRKAFNPSNKELTNSTDDTEMFSAKEKQQIEQMVRSIVDELQRKNI